MRYKRFPIIFGFTIILILILGLYFVAYSVPPEGKGQGKRPKPPAPVPQTGQTESYYPGDDGDLQRGIPCPEPRFTDNEDGTVTDNCTGLVWLQNANCLATSYPEYDNDGTAEDGQVTWQHALDFVAGINNGTYGECGASYSDWRLPNIKELLSLVDLGFYDPAIAHTSPFTNVQSFYYWSSSSVLNAPPIYEKWFVLFLNGSAHGYDKNFPALVWPVRGGS